MHEEHHDLSYGPAYDVIDLIRSAQTGEIIERFVHHIDYVSKVFSLNIPRFLL